MSAYDAIPDASLDIDAAIRSSDAKKLRDNPLAVTQGDATALAAGEGVFIDKDPGGGSQTAIVTDENDTTKVLTPDGAGSAIWSSALQPGLILIERKEISVAVISTDFLGLDGDVDEVYKMIGRIRKPDFAAQTYEIKPNNTLGGTTRDITNGAAGTRTRITFITTSTGNDGYISFEVLIHARRPVQGHNFPRSFMGKAIEMDSVGAVPQVVDWGSRWDVAANWTSLRFSGSATNAIGIGSTLELFKLKQ